MNKLNQYPVWAALVTPFDKNLNIDFESFKNLIDKQQAVENGILIIGSTGEGLALTIDEKKAIVKWTCDLKLNIPIMVGVGGYNLKQQLDWIDFCNNYPIDAYLLVTPPYAKPGIFGQTHWFKTLMDHATKPCMLYNVPSRTGVTLYPQVIENLKQNTNLWALKEASGKVDAFKQYRHIAPELPIYSGEDALMPELAREGAKGIVSASANVWPDGIKQYVKKCLANEMDDSIAIYQQSIRTFFKLASNPVPAKVLLHYKNWIKEPILRPPLTHKDLIDINRLIELDENMGRHPPLKKGA